MLSAVLVMALAAAGAAPGVASATPVKAGKVFVSVESQTERGPRREFSAHRSHELQFVVRGGLAGEEIELRVYTPKGHLYQVIGVGQRDAGGAALSRRPAGEQPIVAGPASVDGAVIDFPVSGTLIVTSGLYGKWRVVPHVVGRSEPRGPELTFELGR